MAVLSCTAQPAFCTPAQPYMWCLLSLHPSPTPVLQIVPPVLAEFTLRTNPLRLLAARCLPFLPVFRKFDRSVKVCGAGVRQPVMVLLQL